MNTFFPGKNIKKIGINLSAVFTTVVDFNKDPSKYVSSWVLFLLWNSVIAPMEKLDCIFYLWYVGKLLTIEGTVAVGTGLPLNGPCGRIALVAPSPTGNSSIM